MGARGNIASRTLCPRATRLPPVVLWLGPPSIGPLHKQSHWVTALHGIEILRFGFDVSAKAGPLSRCHGCEISVRREGDERTNLAPTVLVPTILEFREP